MNNRTTVAKLFLVVMMLIGLIFIALVSIGNLKKMGKYKGDGLAIELGTSLVNMYDKSLVDLKPERQEMLNKELLVTPVIATENKVNKRETSVTSVTALEKKTSKRETLVAPIIAVEKKIQALAKPVIAVKNKASKISNSSRLVVADDGTTYRLVKIVKKKQKMRKVKKVVKETQIIKEKKEIK